MVKLSTAEVDAKLKSLAGWSVNSSGKLEREFKFGGFAEAFSFMTRIAFEAERMDHHPDWSNSYNRVNVQLVTHAAKGLTENDFALARKINEISWV